MIRNVVKSLPNQYTIRGITRDLSKPEVKALEELGIDIVEGDFSDSSSLEKALKDVHAVFSLSTMNLEENGISEYEQGKMVANAAVKQGVEFFIWSTLPHVKTISNGKFVNVKHFDAKAEVEKYIRGLPLKSAFIAPGFFFQNFLSILKPQAAQDGLMMYNVLKRDSKFPCIDVIEDFGKFVVTILQAPENHEGRVLCASSGAYSYAMFERDLSKASGKKVSYVQLPLDQFKSFLPSKVALDITEMFQFYDEYSFGPSTDEDVNEALKEISFIPVSAEKFFEAHSSAF